VLCLASDCHINSSTTVERNSKTPYVLLDPEEMEDSEEEVMLDCYSSKQKKFARANKSGFPVGYMAGSSQLPVLLQKMWFMFVDFPSE